MRLRHIVTSIEAYVNIMALAARVHNGIKATSKGRRGVQEKEGKEREGKAGREGKEGRGVCLNFLRIAYGKISGSCTEKFSKVGAYTRTDQEQYLQ